MTAKEVSVGLTYEVKVSDVLVPVTLTSECPYGGWYGKNLATDHTVRIKTAGRLRRHLATESERQAALQANEVHTTTMEATVPTSTEVKNARAARRTAKPAPTVTPIEESPMPAKPAAKSKPAARRNGTVKMSADIIAAAAGTTVNKPAVKRTAKPKPTVKPVVIKLAPGEPKVNSFSFKFTGKDDNPLVTTVYLMIPLLERFAADGTPVEITFNPYNPVGKQAQRPKSRIRYSGSEDTIRDLYVDRALITKMGYTDDKCPTVTVTVVKDNNITLTFTPNS